MFDQVIPWKFRRKQNNFARKEKTIAFSKTYCRIYLLLIVVSSSFLPGGNAQQLSGGLFPGVKDVASFKSITTTSTCGLNNKQTTFCMSSIYNKSITSCTQRTCLFNCCEKCGKSTPSYVDIDIKGTVSGGIYISADRRPKSDIYSQSKSFINKGYIVYNSIAASSNFTFATWVKQNVNNVG